MRHLLAQGMSGDRDFFSSIISAWILFAQVKQPIVIVLFPRSILFLKQIVLLGVWDVQEGVFGVPPWQLLCLHALRSEREEADGPPMAYVFCVSLCHLVV